MTKRTVLTALACIAFLMCQATEVDTSKVVSLAGIEVVSNPKESGSLRQLPSTVNIIRRRQLADNQASSLKGVSSLVPNFFIPDYGSRLTSAIYMRGIGSRLNTPAVGLYVDNIPYIDKSAFDFRFYDIERVDIMRGPQGTLYGRNAMGGIIKVHTRNPFRYQGTDISLGFSSGDSHRTASLTHYHLMSEQFAFSAGGYYEGGSGFFRNATTGKRVDAIQAGGGRMRGIYMPSSALKVDLSAGYDYSDEGAYPYHYVGRVSGTEDIAGQIGRINNNRESRYRRGMFNAGLNIEYSAPAYTLNAVTGYQNLTDRMFLDQDFTSADIYSLEQRQRINTITEEITIRNNSSGKWQRLTGINLMFQQLHTTGPVTFYADGLRWLESNINTAMPDMSRIPMLQMMGFTGMGINFRGDEMHMSGTYDTPTLGAAIFHQSTYQLSRRLAATVGLRLDFEHQQLKYHSPAAVDYGFTMSNSVNQRMAIDLQDLHSDILYSGKLTNNHLRVLPKVALKYDIDNCCNLYTSVAMGQRSGGYNLQMFSDLLQGAMRVDMMQGVQDGVGNYMDYLAANVPTMPKAIPDPDNPGTMVPIPTFVRRMMAKSMPKFEKPSAEQVVYRPEYSLNFELGAHLTLDERRLSADIAVFNNYIYDQQIARFAPSGLGRMMVNAGRSHTCGAEMSLDWKATEHLHFMANYGFTHAQFKKYDGGNGIDYSGKYVPFVPMHTANIDAAYTFLLKSATFRSLTIGCNYSGAGRVYWNEANTASQDYYQTLGARLMLGCSFGDIMLWARNITDTHYNTFYFESAGRGFEQHGKPAHIGVNLNLHI